METKEWEHSWGLRGHWRNAKGRMRSSGKEAGQDHSPNMEELECPKQLAESSDCSNPIREEVNPNARITVALWH